MSEAIHLEISGIEHLEQGYRIHWQLSRDSRILSVQPLEITYDFAPPRSPFYPTHNLLALVLPVLANEFPILEISVRWPIDLRLSSYWAGVLRALRIPERDVRWDIPTLGTSFQDQPGPAEPGTRSGLLFGGGIESMFALSVLYADRPVLISVLGEAWMNNDPRTYRIKRALEDDLVASHGVHLERVTSNALSLIRKEDLYKNYFVTGLLFYWHSLPVCRQFQVHTLYKSSEMEEALNFRYQDLSLHPTFLKHIRYEGEPLFLPLHNCYPKIQMFAELSRTPFLRFIYSCYHNTDRRWCGECSKCFRISEFCDRVGIDRALIGMQGGIVGRRERGPISRHYWDLADLLYGKRRLHESRLAFEYHKQRALRRLGRAWEHLRKLGS